jgi:membrane protein DedA with SNARE-associated domain
MASKYPNILKRLRLFALGLLLVALFAPMPDLLDKILTLVAAVLVLIVASGYWWDERRKRQADQSSSAAISSSDQM